MINYDEDFEDEMDIDALLESDIPYIDEDEQQDEESMTEQEQPSKLEDLISTFRNIRQPTETKPSPIVSKREEVDRQRQTNQGLLAINNAMKNYAAAQALRGGAQVPVRENKMLNKLYEVPVYKPMDDPESEISKAYQQYAKKLLPNVDANDLSANELKQFGVQAADLTKQENKVLDPKDDPNSTISDIYRQRIKNIYPQLAESISDDVTAGQLEKMLAKSPQVLSELDKARTKYYATRAEYKPHEFELAQEKESRQREAEDRRQSKFQFTVSDDEERDRREAQKEVRKDPRWKSAQEIRMAMDKVRDTLERAKGGDETALATLGVQVAKAMGEKGMLSETDVRRYIDASSLLGQLHSSIMRQTKAKPSPEVASSILNMLNDMESHVDQELNIVFDEQAKWYQRAQAAQNRDVTYDEARWVVDPNEQKPNSLQRQDIPDKERSDKIIEAPYGDIVEKGGKTYKWNMLKGKYQLFDK